MFARKTAVVAAAVAISLTVAGGFAYADSNQPTAPAAQTQTKDQTPELAAKRQQLADLTKAIKSLHQQIKAQQQTNKQLVAKLGGGKAGADARAALKQQYKDLKSQLAAAKGDKAKVQQIRAQIKDLLAQRKGDLGAVKALKGQLQPLQEQEKQLRQAVSELQTQHKSAEQALKTARQAKDKAAAGAALDRLISLEQQIQAKAQEGLTLTRQVGAVLQSANH